MKTSTKGPPFGRVGSYRGVGLVTHDPWWAMEELCPLVPASGSLVDSCSDNDCAPTTKEIHGKIRPKLLILNRLLFMYRIKGYIGKERGGVCV